MPQVSPKDGIGEVSLFERLLRALGIKDAHAVTVRLFDRFGSAHGVIDATAEELASVSGMTERAALFVVFVRPALRQALLRAAEREKLSSEAAVVRFCMSYFIGGAGSTDTVAVLTKKLMPVRTVAYGSLADVVGAACRLGADGAVLINGRKTPVGMIDLKTVNAARDICSSLALVGVELLDVVEYSQFRFLSIRRAVAGDEKLCDVLSASERPFERIDLLKELTAYAARREKALRTAYLK